MLRMAPERIDESENPDGLAAQRPGKVEGQGMALRHFVNFSGPRCILAGPAPWIVAFDQWECMNCVEKQRENHLWLLALGLPGHGDRINAPLIPTNTGILTLTQARTDD